MKTTRETLCSDVLDGVAKNFRNQRTLLRTDLGNNFIFCQNAQLREHVVLFVLAARQTLTALIGTVFSYGPLDPEGRLRTQYTVD
jgi:hypothetical protein